MWEVRGPSSVRELTVRGGRETVVFPPTVKLRVRTAKVTLKGRRKGGEERGSEVQLTWVELGEGLVGQGGGGMGGSYSRVLRLKEAARGQAQIPFGMQPKVGEAQVVVRRKRSSRRRSLIEDQWGLSLNCPTVGTPHGNPSPRGARFLL